MATTAHHQPWEVLNVDVGGAQSALALDHRRSRLYVVCEARETLVVIDTQSLTVFRTIRVGPEPMSVALDPVRNLIYIATEGDGRVVCMDGDTLTITGAVHVGGLPCAVAVAPLTRAVYVLDRSGDTMTVLDGQRHHLVASASVGREQAAIAFDVDRTTSHVLVYVVSSGDRLVTCVDGHTHQVVSSCRVGRRPADLAVHPETHEVFVPCEGPGDLAILFPGATGMRTSVAAGRRPTAVALIPGRPNELTSAMVAVANFLVPGAVTLLDLATLQVRATISVDGYPSHLAFDRAKRLLFVVHEETSIVSIIDVDAHHVVGEPRVGISDQRRGAASQHVAIDPRGSPVYVTNGLSSHLSVLTRG